MQPNLNRSLAKLELRLRPLLPAQLYADTWIDPSIENLSRVFKHLRTLLYILGDYVPPPIKRNPPVPGERRASWQEGTLLFTDLAGFTPFMEANAIEGKAGAEKLLGILNRYFASMVEIISKSGGELLEFTGDAILAQFLSNRHQDDIAWAIKAGLRMQRAMVQFEQIETARGKYDLKMRIGIHQGRFLTVDVGTPLRMGRVLLGRTVKQAKQAEGGGLVDRVCLTQEVMVRVQNQFRLERHGSYGLVIDDLRDDVLGDYEISVGTRSAAPILFGRSPSTLLDEIKTLVDHIEPLANYQPRAVLGLLVESAAKRKISPNLPKVTILFVNLLGLVEVIDKVSSSEETGIVTCLSRLFASINATVSSQGGILQRITYHPNGSDLLIIFGVPTSHCDDTLRAATTALKIREQIRSMPPITLQSHNVQLTCQIGIARGKVFAAEIGEPRGRREYNILGDTVNTAARLMTTAQPDQILMTTEVEQAIQADILLSTDPPQFNYTDLGEVALKGKSKHLNVFALDDMTATLVNSSN